MADRWYFHNSPPSGLNDGAITTNSSYSKFLLAESPDTSGASAFSRDAQQGISAYVGHYHAPLMPLRTWPEFAGTWTIQMEVTLAGGNSTYAPRPAQSIDGAAYQAATGQAGLQSGTGLKTFTYNISEGIGADRNRRAGILFEQTNSNMMNVETVSILGSANSFVDIPTIVTEPEPTATQWSVVEAGVEASITFAGIAEGGAISPGTLEPEYQPLTEPPLDGGGGSTDPVDPGGTT